MDVAIAVLLVAAVVIELTCAIGLLRMESALDRIHFLGPATILGPLAIAAAAWLRGGADQASVKSTVVLVLLIVTGPVLSFVTARAVVVHTERQ